MQKLLNPGSPTPRYGPICTGTVQIFQVDLGCTLDNMASFHVVTLQQHLVSALRGLPYELNLETLIPNPNPPDPPLSQVRAGKRAARGAVTSRARQIVLGDTATPIEARARWSVLPLWPRRL